VKYANEHSQAATERSSQDAYDAIRLTRGKAAVWTTDDVVHWIHFFKKKLHIYFLPPVALRSRLLRDDKNEIRYKTLLYLFII